jgi:ferritin-like metal-binding protein YciE
MKTLNDLFQDSIKDIYNSEHQLLKAMPKMREKAQGKRLKEAFDTHIEQTHEHVRRIERICHELDFSPTGKTCQGTMGIVKEADEELDEFAGSPAGDAAIIGSAQKAEHYEISNYGSVLVWAEELDLPQNVIEVLEQTLQEEEETDELLSSIAEANSEAATAR